jgi:hypothetical protein
MLAKHSQNSMTIAGQDGHAKAIFQPSFLLMSPKTLHKINKSVDCKSVDCAAGNSQAPRMRRMDGPVRLNSQDAEG